MGDDFLQINTVVSHNKSVANFTSLNSTSASDTLYHIILLTLHLLVKTIMDIKPFYWLIKSLLCGKKYGLKHQHSYIKNCNCWQDFFSPTWVVGQMGCIMMWKLVTKISVTRGWRVSIRNMYLPFVKWQINPFNRNIYKTTLSLQG